MQNAWICDAVRTPIGRYGGGLSSIRTDDLGAVPIKALLDRNPDCDPGKIDDLIYGCANQAGEDNRNVARMSALLAGVPTSVPALCRGQGSLPPRLDYHHQGRRAKPNRPPGCCCPAIDQHQPIRKGCVGISPFYSKGSVA